jgi:predicted MFS family arabinose efflux permease
MTVLRRFLILVGLRWFPVGLAAPVGLLLPLDRGLSLAEIGFAAPAAALMRVLQGVAVAAIGLSAGLAGIIAAYLVCYLIHGTSNSAHTTLLHGQAESRVLATVVSLNSWISQAAFAVGAVVLASLAQSRGVPTAMLTGAVILALAAPLYWPARRNSRPPTPG